MPQPGGCPNPRACRAYPGASPVNQTDCLAFVNGCRWLEKAHPPLQPVLYDFRSLYNDFIVIQVVNVGRINVV